MPPPPPPRRPRRPRPRRRHTSAAAGATTTPVPPSTSFLLHLCPRGRLRRLCLPGRGEPVPPPVRPRRRRRRPAAPSTVPTPIGRPIWGVAGFSASHSPNWSSDASELLGPDLSPGAAFRDYALRNFHSGVFDHLSVSSSLHLPTPVWASPYPRLLSCNIAWVRTTLNYWLDGSCPRIQVEEAAPATFSFTVARPSIAQFILSLGDLRHGRVRLRLFPSAAAARAAVPVQNPPELLAAGNIVGCPSPVPAAPAQSAHLAHPPASPSPSVGTETAPPHPTALSACHFNRPPAPLFVPTADGSCAWCTPATSSDGLGAPPLPRGAFPSPSPCAECRGIIPLPTGGRDLPPSSVHRSVSPNTSAENPISSLLRRGSCHAAPSTAARLAFSCPRSAPRASPSLLPLLGPRPSPLVM